MKKVIVVLGCVICVLLGGIVWLLKDNLETEEYHISVDYESATEYLKIYVGRSDYEETKSAEGYCQCDVGEKSEQLVYTNDAVMKVERFQDFDEEETVALIDGEEVVLGCTGKLLDYTIEEQSVTLTYIDYEDFWVSAEVPQELLHDLSYDTTTYVYVGDKQYSATIQWMDWRVVGGYTTVNVKTEAKMLPGEQVRVVFVMDVYPDVVAVKTEYILEDNVGTFLYWQDELSGVVEKIYFTVVQGGDDYSIIDIDEVYVNGWMLTEYN